MLERRSVRNAVLVLLLAAQVATAYALWRCERRVPPRDPHLVLSFAQQGEDLLIENLFAHLGGRLETYLDLGAYDPIEDSNTYLFYLRGARGVLVEPNPYYVQRLRERRPEDTVLAVGVGVGVAREADYFVVEDGRSGWNTFSPEQASEIRATGRRVRVERLPLVPVNEILEAEFGARGRAVDLLSLDIEGLDLAILESYDFERFRPKVVCVETKALTSHALRPEVQELLVGLGYELRAATFVNSIFVDQRWIETTRDS